jgi:hypothetical protein
MKSGGGMTTEAGAPGRAVGSGEVPGATELPRSPVSMRRMAGRRRRHTPLGAPGQPPGGRGWSADTWGYVVALVVTAIGVSLGIALIMTGASARERGSGWILVIETPLVGIAVIALSRWIQRLATSGRLDLESAGRWTVSSPGWDRMKRRRFLLLWYLGTILAAVGVAITFVTPFGLVGGLLSGLFCYALARRSLRLAMGLSRLESMLLGPHGGHPIAVASRREPGTWWARWAWVDLAIEIAVVAAVLMNLPA